MHKYSVIRLEETDLESFWVMVIRVLGVIAEKPCTPQHSRILAHCLTISDMDAHPLHKQWRQALKDKLDISEQTLTMHMAEMKRRGWLDNNSMPHEILITLRDKIAADEVPEYKLGIPFVISLNEPTEHQSTL